MCGLRVLSALLLLQYLGSYGTLLNLTGEEIRLTRKWWNIYKKLNTTGIALSTVFAKLLPDMSEVETMFRDEMMAIATKKNGSIVIDGSELLMAWLSKILSDLDNETGLKEDIEDIKLRYNKAYYKDKFKRLNEEILKVAKRDLGAPFDSKAQEAVNKTILAILHRVTDTP